MDCLVPFEGFSSNPCFEIRRVVVALCWHGFLLFLGLILTQHFHLNYPSTNAGEFHSHPHPDFLQLVYLADAGKFVPAAQVPGEYEFDSGFRRITAAAALPLTARQRIFLDAAIKLRNTQNKSTLLKYVRPQA